MRLSFGIRLLTALGTALLLTHLKPEAAAGCALLGELFLELLRWTAPIVVAGSLLGAVVRSTSGTPRDVRRILALYGGGILGASAVTILIGMLWPADPPTIGRIPPLHEPNAEGALPVTGLSLLLCVAGALCVGLVLKRHPCARATAAAERCTQGTLRLLMTFLPFGIFGLTCGALALRPAEVLASAADVTRLLFVSTLTAALLFNPLLFALALRRNPLPPLWLSLRWSAPSALLSRSSMMNLPVNLTAARHCGIPSETARIVLPIGAVLNMPGAAVSLAGLTLWGLSAGGQPDVATVLTIFAGAAGGALLAAGIPNGSAVLLPTLLAVVGADPSVTGTVLSVYFMAGLLQDAVGTALNSSSDLFFAFAAKEPTDGTLGSIR